MIYCCPALECLLLNRNSGSCCVRINSISLRSICVGAEYYSKLQLQELVIEDAPCLERLLYLQGHMDIHVSIFTAPKLQTLGCLTDGDNCARLLFGTTAIQGLHVASLATVVHNVKILAVNPSYINLDTVIDLMKCFPCLEKLYIQFCISGELNVWHHKHMLLIKCLDIRLKTIVLHHYRGIESQVKFASFFLLNAKELELLRLIVGNSDYNEAFFAEQHGMLQMEKRASRDARLHFTTNRCHHDLHVNHVRDLSITDPFECRC
uniref:Uncharacterized protein n=1 Tax=Arundo donax TaxID=35708 RepID=A0A0A8ZVT4_ARUDO